MKLSDFATFLATRLLPVRAPLRSFDDGQLYISLTSHAPRFKYLDACLKSLLSQSLKPTGVLLWIEKKDLGRLPASVLRLRRKGLTILECENGLRSYCKIIPALERYPRAFLVTADDDYIYPRDWLAGLVEAYQPGQREVLCYRAHQIATADEKPDLFRAWSRTSPTGISSPLLFALGYGGVLYPPGILGPGATDRIFLDLSPTGDDIWLYFMARRNGATIRRIPGGRATRLPSANIASLKRINLAEDQAQHQRNLDAMVDRFGFPTDDNRQAIAS
ncbi:MAG TPA: hypothetical protein VIZ90_11135 [Rhizobiaceae bacterium]